MIDELKIKSQLDEALARSGQGDHAYQVSYLIFGAAASTTRAFDNVSLRVDPDTNRIFVKVKLRWWAKFKKFKPLHEAWLRRAEKRCKDVVPTGWKLLIYYEGGTE